MNQGPLPVDDGALLTREEVYELLVLIGGKTTVVPKVDTYNVQKTDTNKVFTLEYGSSKTFNLPSVGAGDVGLQYTFVKLGVGDLVIQAADSDIIIDSAAGGTLTNTGTDKASITLVLVSETLWIVPTLGTWVAS